MGMGKHLYLRKYGGTPCCTTTSFTSLSTFPVFLDKLSHAGLQGTLHCAHEVSGKNPQKMKTERQMHHQGWSAYFTDGLLKLHGRAKCVVFLPDPHTTLAVTISNPRMPGRALPFGIQGM
jgi:hypothetical protein